jgi:hypothetical protein
LEPTSPCGCNLSWKLKLERFIHYLKGVVNLG